MELKLNEETLIGIINKAPIENDHWDFKEKWHEDNGELLRDIINFVNTPHHDDCYIILGVNDKNGEIVGIDKDPNRRNKQQLQDYLRRQPFAQNCYPLTNVETFKLSGHYIDVITIKNSNNVPIYLNRRVNRKGKPMQPGLIYSRINDSNTPVDESTSDNQLELLWAKRFHLDVSIYDRYKVILMHPEDWEQIITEDNHESYIYLRDPNFAIKVDGPLENKNSHFESFMMSEFNIRVEWFIIKLFYGNNEIYYNYDIPIDDSSAEIIIPDHHFINVNSVFNGISYHCYIKDELPYILTNFINDVRNVSYAGYWWNHVTADNVFYETKKEKAYYEKLVFDNYEKVKSSEFASDPETVQYLTNKIKLSGTRGEGGDITLIAKEMEKEHLLVKYIKKLQSKNSTQSK